MVPIILALYANMAPVKDYLMPRSSEVALARSAAPLSISDNATVLVLGPRGYYVAVTGSNGFVCLVERGWLAAFDWPQIWNPKIRAADCLNPPAARSLVPVDELKTRLFLGGDSKSAVLSAVKAAYAARKLPALEPGAMSYMMGRGSYLTDLGDHNGPHLMFFMPFQDAAPWGSDLPKSPIQSVSFWFISGNANTLQGLPPLRVFVIGMSKWSDGSAVSGAAFESTLHHHQ
jgi:hypothetical protein